MKKCPICNQSFTNDNDFCPEDGSVLTADGFVFQPSSEMPTQFIPTPQGAAPPAAAGSSNILYLVIGVLSTALVGLGLYLFILRDQSIRTTNSNYNSSQINTTASVSPSPAPTVAAASTENRNISPIPSKPVVAAFTSPSGKWLGQWTNGKGAVYGDELTLRDDGNGRVSGQIVHTVQQTSNPDKLGKIGMTAVEYVAGTYDPKTRMITMKGMRKDDPNKLIILDKYVLSVSADNSTVAGATFGGQGGRVSLRR